MKLNKLLLLYGLVIVLTSLGCKDKSPIFETGDAAGNEYSDYERKTQSLRTEIFSPEKELAGFQVPEASLWNWWPVKETVLSTLSIWHLTMPVGCGHRLLRCTPWIQLPISREKIC